MRRSRRADRTKNPRETQEVVAKERAVDDELEQLLERRGELEQGLSTLRTSSQVRREPTKPFPRNAQMGARGRVS